MDRWANGDAAPSQNARIEKLCLEPTTGPEQPKSFDWLRGYSEGVRENANFQVALCCIPTARRFPVVFDLGKYVVKVPMQFWIAGKRGYKGAES